MTAVGNRPPDRVIIACEARRAVVLEALSGARSRILLSLFRCNDRQIFAALADAVARGVETEVLVTSRAKGGRQKLRSLWERLEATGATVSPYNDAVVKYHAKYLVVDDGPALVTSMNFTRKCFTRTCDAIVSTHDPGVVHGLRELMRADREGRPAPATLPARLIVGPEAARRRFTEIIASARSSVQLIDAKLSDPAVLTLLQLRRREGVTVDVFDGKHLGGMKSHGKILLVDRALAVVGSAALTALSLDFRREVALACDEPAAVIEIEQLFRSLGAAAGASPVAGAGGTSC